MESCTVYFYCLKFDRIRISMNRIVYVRGVRMWCGYGVVSVCVFVYVFLRVCASMRVCDRCVYACVCARAFVCSRVCVCASMRV